MTPAPAPRDLEYAPELALHRTHPALNLHALDFDDSRDARLHLAAVLLAITPALRRQIAEYRQATELQRRLVDDAFPDADAFPF